jgi:choline dehydrogenase
MSNAVAPSSLDRTSEDEWDYIIVGGGSAGCALANRLSADPKNKVLVLEAGRPDYKWDIFIHMPAALTFPIGSRLYDWKYESEPEPHMNGRRVYHARGKVLGGSSSINGMIFQRGNPLDYERWAADPGMEQWSYANCLPYFKRMENTLAGGDKYRGDAGPLTLERGPMKNPLFASFLEATEQAGFHRTADVNGYRQEGFAAFDRNLVRGRRLSAARAYLHPVMKRPNLTVKTSAHTTRVVFEGTKAVGVEYESTNLLKDLVADSWSPFTKKLPKSLNGLLSKFSGKRAATTTRMGSSEPSQLANSIHSAKAALTSSSPISSTGTVVRGKEIILCGGAINSPQLLQLSGVGNAEELRALGIESVVDLPGVGENMQDHLEVYVQHSCKEPVSMSPGLKWRNRPWIGFKWLFFRNGPGATNHFEAGGFARSNDKVKYPNLMFHFLPIAVRYDGSAPEGGHGYQVHVGPMYSDSKGSVKITSKDPFSKPALRFNYLSTETDRSEWAEAISVTRKILSQPAMDRYNGGEISPGPSVSTEAEILDWVARDSETALHPSCSCRMGTDEMSVLDPNTLRVHGTQGLRVVDASAMRYVTNGNIYAPVMMLAEKAADMILGKTPLAPEHVDFYRHEN